MDYPRLPAGPTPAGAAGVRGLLAEGGEFQRTRRTTDTESRVMGEFLRATVEGAEYVCGAPDTAGAVKYRAGQRYLMPFVPSIATLAQVNMGRGQYASFIVPDDPPIETLTYNYTVRPGDVRPYVIDRLSTERGVGVGGFWGAGRQVGAIAFEVYSQIATGMITPNVPSLVLTRPAPPHPDVSQLAMAVLGDGGRTDAAGRGLQDVFLLSLYRSLPPVARALPTAAFTRADAEFSPFIPTLATKTRTYAIVAEQFFKVGAYPGGADPKVFLLYAADHNLDSPSIADITSVMVDGRLLPFPVTLSGGQYWLPTSGDGFAGSLSQMMGTMRLVALPDDWGLCFYRVRCNDGGTYQWHSRAVRFRAVGGVVATRVLDEVLPADANGAFHQSAVHLGENWVLSKKVLGFNGVGLDVEFMRSADGGVSWSTITPTGFSTPLKNQYFGDLVVHTARKGGAHGVVLITAWDAESQAYCVYESKDGGALWKRRGRVHKPADFQRVDSMVVGDGGGYYETLVPGPNPARAVDVTITDRYSAPE